MLQPTQPPFIFGDNAHHNLVCAAGNRDNTCVANITGDGIFFHKAHAAMKLLAGVGDGTA